MAIFLFTDFGAADIYVGQVKAVLAARAPRIPVIDLLHEAPSFNVRAGAHLLAALAGRTGDGDVVMAVVDPGVGSPRDAVTVRAGGCWMVGPDNGLLSVSAARAQGRDISAIGWRPQALSISFHGRDLFAPVAAMLACRDEAPLQLERKGRLAVDFGANDLSEIIYLDHYGNALTGLRAGNVDRSARLAVANCHIGYAPVFSAAPPGTPFWYENSIGLVEIAVSGASAAHALKLSVGQPVAAHA